MKRFSVKEAMEFFRSSGADCDEMLVQEWMNETKTMDINCEVCKADFIRFDMWHRQKGTAYEEGISDRVRIVRLFVEINELKKEILALTREKECLQDKITLPKSISVHREVDKKQINI